MADPTGLQAPLELHLALQTDLQAPLGLHFALQTGLQAPLGLRFALQTGLQAPFGLHFGLPSAFLMQQKPLKSVGGSKFEVFTFCPSNALRMPP